MTNLEQLKIVSKEDFIPKLQEEGVIRLFAHLGKSFNPLKKIAKYLPCKKRGGMTECRTVVSYYNMDEVIDGIQDKIDNPCNRHRKHISEWEKHLDLLRSVND